MIKIMTILEATSVILACGAVIAGIGAWKREFIGKRKIELAEETLAVFFELKDAISFIRNPWSSSNEGSSRERSENETEDEAKLLDRGYIVFERYDSRKDIFIKFNVLKYKFMAVFGTKTENIFKDTDSVLQSIFISANMLSTHYWQRQGRVRMEKDEFQKHLDEMHHHESVFWDRYRDGDEIRDQLKTIQNQLEEVTKPCFDEPMKTYSFFTKKWSIRRKKD